MVNKRQKTEGAVTKAATAAPKSRAGTKPKPAARAAAAEPLAKAAKTPKAKAVKLPAPSQDEIALRAYFISEKRQQLGLPGDPISDWVQAETELLGKLHAIGLN
jgi:hypothetical protein